MDALVRRRLLLLKGRVAFALAFGAAPVLALLVACGGDASSRGAVGVSDKPRTASGPAAVADAGARDGAALPNGYRASFLKVNRARYASQGHATGRWEADVYANDAGARALATRAREAPEGAMVVAEHFERATGTRGESGPVYLMEKRERGYAPDHGDWRYVVVGSKGQLVNEGVIGTCAGCHDGAPMDGLFPVLE